MQQGRQEGRHQPLFRGLYAHDQWGWAIKYPVIHISFAGGRLESRQQLDFAAAPVGRNPLTSADRASA
jgi:hypothetical protein